MLWEKKALKHEEVYHQSFATKDEFRLHIGYNYVEKCNEKRTA
jgi:hypothetical protein